MKREIWQTKQKESCINYTAGVVDSLRIKDTTKTTVRVYDNGFIGVAGKSGDCDIEELTKKAVESLENKVPYPSTKDDAKTISVDKSKKIIDDASLVEKCKELVAKVAQQNSDFVINGKFSINDSAVSYSNSDGVDYSCKSSQLGVYFTAKDKKSSNIMDEFYSCSDTVFEPEKIARDAKNIFDAFLNKINQVEEDEAVVIVEPSFVYYLINAFVAELYCTGASLLKDKLNTKIFDQKVNIYCEQDPDKDPNAVFFDGEGVVNEGLRSYLVKDGVMTNLLTTKKSSAMFGVANNGTAGSPFASVPTLGAKGLDFGTTCKDVKELLGNKKAIYVTVTSGGDMTTSGDVSLPVQVAYLYEDGKLVGRLPEFTISGSIFDILGKDFVGVCEKCVNEAGKNKYVVFNAKLVNKQA